MCLFELWFSQGICPIVELLGHMVILGEGNGNPLQYSCLEDPVDGGAWKAAVHGVAEGYMSDRVRVIKYSIIQ